MSNYSTEIIETISRVMADSFREDPLNQVVFNGVDKKDELLDAHSLIHTHHAVNTRSLTLLDGSPKAFLIGFDSKTEQNLRNALLIIKIYFKTFCVLGLKDLKKIFSNNKKAQKILSFNWYKKFITGRHYRVKVIAIDKEMRGSGAFRRLITPAIEFCDNERIPMVLETHNYNNVGLYEHFGFELVKTITSPETEIKQYCMIRKPAG
ncbi:MAG TPA: GNAT family N-acetyltransferase [Ignavibacteriaceae bacterium]|nr:GNAT family N-acetyltransferase [Ignavibacteriaceae bacterium]